MCEILCGYFHSKKTAFNSTEQQLTTLEAVLRQQKPFYPNSTLRHLSVHVRNICLAALRFPTDGIHQKVA